MSPPLQVEWHADPAIFSTLAAEWTTLMGCDPGATVFQSPAWSEIWWRHHAGRNRLAVLAVREEGRLVGVAPLMVAVRGGCVRILPIGYGEYAYFGPVVLPDRTDVARELAHALAGQYPRALLHIPYSLSRNRALAVLAYPRLGARRVPAP